MTDARLPERLLNDRRLQRLSAEHYRAYVNCLLWSVANRTDGRIEREDLALIPHWSANAAKAFVDAKLFAPDPEGWLIADYAATQTSRSELETLENIRARDRERKAAARAKGKDRPPDSPGDSPADVPEEVSPGTTQAGRQAGRKALEGEPPEPESVSGNGEYIPSDGLLSRAAANVIAGYET